MSLNSKKKGNSGENRFANWLRTHGIAGWRNSGSGAGIAKSDVHNPINANFEVKTVKKLNLREAWEQSVRDAGVYNTPYVVIHFDGMPQDQWLIVMSNHDWIELYQKSREPKTLQAENRDLQWKLRRLIQSAKELLKEIEE